MSLNETQRKILREIAWQSIQYGLTHEYALLNIDLSQIDDALKTPLASFVTLHKSGDLRGCIGSLEASQPLVIDVIHNANAAAFSDPRFAPLQEIELPEIELSISVLSKPQPMTFSSEEDLLSQLKPGVDGLIIEENNYRRGTFLPAVWEQLPEPKQFLNHLKQKANLPKEYWSLTIKASRYTTESF